MPPPNATTQCHHPMPPPDQRSTKTKPPLPTFAPESARKCLAAPRVYASRGAGLCLGPRIRMGFDTPVLEVPCAPFRAGSVGHHSRSLLPRRLPIPGLNAASPRVSNIQRTRKWSPIAIHSRMRHGLIPTLNDNRSFSAPGRPLAAHGNGVGLIRSQTLSPGRPMMKPRFRMDRACEGALSGRILFWGRFSHGVAMG
jgi:hypothetical protein